MFRADSSSSTISEIDGELCLRLDKSKGTTYLSMFDMLNAWQQEAEKERTDNHVSPLFFYAFCCSCSKMLPSVLSNVFTHADKSHKSMFDKVEETQYDVYVIKSTGGCCSVFEIEYYRTENGQKPIEEFIDSLELKMQGKVFRQIGLLKEHGHLLGDPFSSLLDKGIYELRIQQSNNIVRILYFFIRDRKIVLTHGFTKKTQKTPPGEIERAKKYKADYERRGINHG